ncbi:hypothetical protein C2G38_2139851 [Gigaspora rosea]|uniref:Galactose oxidase n=1 Tax=Gigaspora rosea TaxID=44941 RepID=A0A397VTC8_9GLOM|nr:hypothetical protein C2G38_2139851 [Gigaspora rosea]
MHTIFYIVKECRIRCAKAKSLKTEYKILRLACERSDLSWLYLVEKKIIFLRKIFLLLPTPWEKQHFDVEYDRSCVAAWSLSNATNAPLPMYGYCAITLPDGNILYIGGIRYSFNSTYMPMNNLPLYNTISDTWTNMSISGPSPSPREHFSTVLTSDGRIIIFGGSTIGITFGDLWILDITMFQWSIGKILNPIVNLTLYAHTATLVDNYMFVAFGDFGNRTLSSKIYMLDVSRKDSYKWVTEFTQNTATTSTASTSSSNTSSESKYTSIIIGAIIGSIISLIIFVIASILTLKFIDKQM